MTVFSACGVWPGLSVEMPTEVWGPRALGCNVRALSAPLLGASVAVSLSWSDGGPGGQILGTPGPGDGSLSVAMTPRGASSKTDPSSIQRQKQPRDEASRVGGVGVGVRGQSHGAWSRQPGRPCWPGPSDAGSHLAT